MRALRSNRILENGEKHRNGMFLNWHHTMNWHGRMLLLLPSKLEYGLFYHQLYLCLLAFHTDPLSFTFTLQEQLRIP